MSMTAPTAAAAPAMSSTRARAILRGEVVTVTPLEFESAFQRVEEILAGHADKRRRERARAVARKHERPRFLTRWWRAMWGRA